MIQRFMQRVRPYHHADLADLLSAWENASRIAHSFLEDEFFPEERKRIPELYLPKADTWVLEVNTLVVGFISLIGNEVGAISLQPDYQGKGLGKLLMDKAREIHDDLEVEVFKKNSIGRRFYARYGFKLIEEKTHEETGEQILRLKLTDD